MRKISMLIIKKIRKKYNWVRLWLQKKYKSSRMFFFFEIFFFNKFLLITFEKNGLESIHNLDLHKFHFYIYLFLAFFFTNVAALDWSKASLHFFFGGGGGAARGGGWPVLYSLVQWLSRFKNRDRQRDSQRDKWTDWRTDRQTDIQTDRQMDRQTDRWTDRQTDKLTDGQRTNI